MTTQTDDPLPDLLRRLRAAVPIDRARAARDLGRLGWLARDAIPALVRAADDADGKVREAATQALGQMGPEALPPLKLMLRHDDKYVRRQAVWALGRLGPLARPALAAVCEALRDADPRTASGAAQALGNMGADGADAVPALAEAMRGTNIVLCRLAAKALSQIGFPALATLITHLQHTDPFVRGESALALGWMGAAARPAVPYLAKLVRGSSGRGLADTPPPGSSLSGFGAGSGAVTPTAPAAATEATADDTCRVYAAQALGKMGAAAAAALPELTAASRHGPDPLRDAARQAARLVEGA
ncbi:HEAT repeat domain-containing protein [Urbifossiella limnaea]|uniref:PBS lyase HEAT-like repeat protein n=1 Tax=Urbifossiella limnaea TaxID=2528023 RepID=A0A517XP32_9BACT|nr:HEAT repeat domain-containing protein [Urbifossiella limnaea]QDU19271.1 PBS lyase HEAT-like repeat protein [Urbifossiella limnaea]